MNIKFCKRLVDNTIVLYCILDTKLGPSICCLPDNIHLLKKTSKKQLTSILGRFKNYIIDDGTFDDRLEDLSDNDGFYEELNINWNNVLQIYPSITKDIESLSPTDFFKGLKSKVIRDVVIGNVEFDIDLNKLNFIDLNKLLEKYEDD